MDLLLALAAFEMMPASLTGVCVLLRRHLHLAEACESTSWKGMTAWMC